MISSLLQRRQDRLIAAFLILLWAALFLPNLRTNPNWYGDEGIYMEEAWTFAQGHPRYGAMREDFISPIPHSPVYLAMLGGMLRVFGNDIVVGRAFQALVALATAGILFWVGCRLRSKNFGYLCVAAFLCYPEVVIHYRWIRGNPMQGMWILATVGFLICYVQEKKLRDIVLAGLMCSLAVGSHYFSYPMMGAVVVTAFLVNRRHVWAAAAASGAFFAAFFTWFLLAHEGGLSHLIVRFAGASKKGFEVVDTSWGSEVVRLYRQLVEFVFLTPTLGRDGSVGIDFWILMAGLGMLLFPVIAFRKWLIFWLLAVMWGVFGSRNNAGAFLYQAFGFIPLLSLGFAGMLVRLGELAAGRLPSFGPAARFAPSVAFLGGLGMLSLTGSLGHLQTKVDRWTVQSWKDAEAIMKFINASTSPEDFVVMPDQLFWLYEHERKAQLVQCAHYQKGIEENLTIGVPRDQYWFDCSIENARFLVLACGSDAHGQTVGIDAIFWLGYKGVQGIVDEVQKQNWPIILRQGEYTVLANPRFLKKAPKDSNVPSPR